VCGMEPGSRLTCRDSRDARETAAAEGTGDPGEEKDVGGLFDLDDDTVRALHVRILRCMTCVDIARCACVCRLYRRIIAEEVRSPCGLAGCLTTECLAEHTVDFTWAPGSIPLLHRFEESEPSRLVVSNPPSLAAVLARLREAREGLNPPRVVTALDVYRVHPRPLLVATYERRPQGHHLYVEGGVDSYSDPRAGDEGEQHAEEGPAEEGLRCLVLHCGQVGPVGAVARALASECKGLLLLHVEGHEVPINAPQWTHVLACLQHLREVRVRCLSAANGDTDARPWELIKALALRGHPALRRVLIEVVPADARAGRGSFWGAGTIARLRWASHACGLMLLLSCGSRERTPSLGVVRVCPVGGWRWDQR